WLKSKKCARLQATAAGPRREPAFAGHQGSYTRLDPSAYRLLLFIAVEGASQPACRQIAPAFESRGGEHESASGGHCGDDHRRGVAGTGSPGVRAQVRHELHDLPHDLSKARAIRRIAP